MILGLIGMVLLQLSFIIHVKEGSTAMDGGGAIPHFNIIGDKYSNLSTMATINGEIKWIKCPEWDWSIVEAQCLKDGTGTINRYMIAWNCLPKCGKYEGDRPDIGAWEYFPGITEEKPWGDWNGIPLHSALSTYSKPVILPKVNKFGIIIDPE
jgi:hypothetical protein